MERYTIDTTPNSQKPYVTIGTSRDTKIFAFNRPTSMKRNRFFYGYSVVLFSIRSLKANNDELFSGALFVRRSKSLEFLHEMGM